MYNRTHQRQRDHDNDDDDDDDDTTEPTTATLPSAAVVTVMVMVIEQRHIEENTYTIFSYIFFFIPARIRKEVDVVRI